MREKDRGGAFLLRPNLPGKRSVRQNAIRGNERRSGEFSRDRVTFFFKNFSNSIGSKVLEKRFNEITKVAIFLY